MLSIISELHIPDTDHLLWWIDRNVCAVVEGNALGDC